MEIKIPAVTLYELHRDVAALRDRVVHSRDDKNAIPARTEFDILLGKRLLNFKSDVLDKNTVILRAGQSINEEIVEASTTIEKFVSNLEVKFISELNNDLVGRKRDVSGSDIISSHPPCRAEFLVSLVLPHDRVDDVLGDLRETYSKTIVPRFGSKGAHVWYWVQLLQLSLERMKLLLGIPLGWLLGKLG
ncbi:MAG: hypothetical protein WDZ84_00920 [Rhodovibrionaceae bacterium]